MEPQVVVVSDVERIRSTAQRWCATVGLSVRPVSSLGEARSLLRSADVVLVGQDNVDSLRQGPSAAWRHRLYLVVDDGDRWWREGLELGADGVLEITCDAAGIAALNRAADRGPEGCSLAVVGGRGGVGATTFACALGLGAAGRGWTTVVIDADPVGPGVDLVLGTESDRDCLRWTSFGGSDGKISSADLAAGLPRRSGVATLAWPLDSGQQLLPANAADVWSSATRAFDLVIVDQARCTDTATGPWASVVLGASVLTVLVVPDDILGISAARRQAALVRETTTSLAAVVARTRSGVGLDVVESAIEVPVVGSYGRDRRVRRSTDAGRGPGRSRSLTKSTRGVLDLIGLGDRA